jgi:hypothetical protein
MPTFLDSAADARAADALLADLCSRGGFTNLVTVIR